MTENRRVKKTVSAIAVLFVVIFAFSVAGCGRPYYDQAVGGRDDEDIFLINDDNSVDLLRKKLVYTLDDFDEQSDDKKSELTVTYDMFNPNSEDITRNFALLCDMPTSIAAGSISAKDYSIEYEGKKMDVPKRYVYYDSERYDDYDERVPTVFELQAKVSDEYVQSEEFPADMPVTAYTFDVEYYSIEPRGYIAFRADYLGADKFLLENVTHPEYRSSCFMTNIDNGSFNAYIGLTAHNGDTVKVYVMGEEASSPFIWHIYEDSKRLQNREGQVSKAATEELTFAELVMLGRDDFPYVSEVDFYNATVEYWSSFGYYDDILSIRRLRENDLASMLWGEITLPAKTPVTLTVTRPVNRATNANQYDVPVYTYKFNHYYVNWNYVGEFVLEINSPYYVLDINSGLTQKDGGVYVAEDGFYKDIEFAIAPKQEALTADQLRSRKRDYIFANIPFYLMFGTAATLIGKNFIAANGVWCAVLWLVAVAAVTAIFVTLGLRNYKKRKRALSAAQNTGPQADANRKSEEGDHSEKAD